MTSSSITSKLFNRLAQVASANAQTMSNYRLKLVGDQLTARLNKRIAQLKAQSQDPMVAVLQQQMAALKTQRTGYTNASAKYSANGTTLSDLSLRLSDAALAASNGDSTAFDTAMGAANTDINDLQVVAYVAGIQDDGVAALKYNGLAIKSSATYDLSTPAGQAQAASDVQAAQTLQQQIFGTTTLNQTIVNSVSQSLQGQMTGISNHISDKQFTQLNAAAAEITKLKQQTQQQFHLFELSFGNSGQTASMLQAFQSSRNIAPPAGSVISLMVGSNDGQSLPVANVMPIAPPVIGRKVSTSA